MRMAPLSSSMGVFCMYLQTRTYVPLPMREGMISRWHACCNHSFSISILPISFDQVCIWFRFQVQTYCAHCSNTVFFAKLAKANVFYRATNKSHFNKCSTIKTVQIVKNVSHYISIVAFAPNICGCDCLARHWFIYTTDRCSPKTTNTHLVEPKKGNTPKKKIWILSL